MPKKRNIIMFTPEQRIAIDYQITVENKSWNKVYPKEDRERFPNFIMLVDPANPSFGDHMTSVPIDEPNIDKIEIDGRTYKVQVPKTAPISYDLNGINERRKVINRMTELGIGVAFARNLMKQIDAPMDEVVWYCMTAPVLDLYRAAIQAKLEGN